MGQILVIGKNVATDKDTFPLSMVGPVHAPAAVFVATQSECSPQFAVLLEPENAYSREERAALVDLLHKATLGEEPSKPKDPLPAEKRVLSLADFIRGQIEEWLPGKAVVWRPA